MSIVVFKSIYCWKYLLKSIIQDNRTWIEDKENNLHHFTNADPFSSRNNVIHVNNWNEKSAESSTHHKILRILIRQMCTGHNQYDGKKRDRKNSQDKKEKSDAFSQISFKFSFRISYDYKHSIPWAIWTRNSNQYLSCVLLFNRENE